MLFSGYRSSFRDGSSFADGSSFGDGSFDGDASFDGGWFLTSDLGEIADGGLRVLGRADDVINTGGEKVVAASVAEVLAGHPALADAVVVGAPDPEWGERVVAVVVLADPAQELTLRELRAYCAERLPAYAVPRELRVLPRLPLLPNGKTDMSAIKTGT